MIRLERVPKTIREQYGLLQLPVKTGDSEKYLLFWQPSLRITKFYPGYHGEEILALEEQLASINIYGHRLDGLVGPRLWSAVKRYQEKRRLNVSGFPDSETVFLLCHEKKRG